MHRFLYQELLNRSCSHPLFCSLLEVTSFSCTIELQLVELYASTRFSLCLLEHFPQSLTYPLSALHMFCLKFLCKTLNHRLIMKLLSGYIYICEIYTLTSIWTLLRRKVLQNSSSWAFHSFSVTWIDLTQALTVVCP